MGNRPEDRKKRQAYDHVMEGLGGDLFDIGLEETPPDPIFAMRKYVMHFRLMVFSKTFHHIHEGTVLSFGQPGKLNYADGEVLANGKIRIPSMSRTVPSLTAFATAVIPEEWTKTEKSGKVVKPRPDGWERVWASMDHGGALSVQDILFEHHKDLGYSVDDLSNVELIYSDMVKQGHGDDLKDLLGELKTYRTRQDKLKGSSNAL